MNVAPNKAKKLARSLLRENRKRTWRQIAKEDYGDAVNYATLNKFANSEGTKIPRDEKILIALGLKKAHKPRKASSWLSERIKLMASRTKTAIMTKAELKREAQETKGILEWLR